MSYTIRLTNDLLLDIESLKEYLVTKFSDSISNEGIKQIFNTFDSLIDFPKKRKDAANLMFVFSGYRYLPLEKNILFYLIDEE